ncbi:MAG: cytochrome P450 [Planctomycetaceae bacterium]|nr:cytochrome P450 [Planctomycetaceae bacterium]
MSVIQRFYDGRHFQADPLSYLNQLNDDQDVVFFKAGLTTFCLLRSPEDIKRVLVTENSRFGEGKWTQRGKYVMRDCMITREGAPHRERRKILQPAFKGQVISKSKSPTIQLSLEICNAWNDRQTLDLFPDMNRIALEVVGHSLFGSCFGTRASRINDALSVLLRAIPRPPIPWPRVITARRTIRKTTSQMSEGPLLELMKHAGLKEKEIHYEILSLLIASIDTTPKTIAWALTLIGANVEVEEKLYEEISNVLDGRIPDLDDLAMLPYLNQVIQETLRLYPPVHFIDRRANEDITFGEVTVPAGMYLLLSPLLTQRDPKYFQQPGEFRTERWTPDAVAQRVPFSFYPFGSGPHACIGKKLALVEIALVIAVFVQKWRFRPTENLIANNSPQRTDFPITVSRRL